MTAPRGGVLETPDEALVELAGRGDASAREELFCRHQTVAFRVARRLLGNDEDALDAVQDGLIKAFRHLSEFDGRSTFRTWLLRIVTNASRDLGRRRARRPTVRLADAERDRDREPNGRSAAEPSVESDPAAGLEREELRQEIDAALARLTPKLRETFVLFAEAELPYKEIAQALDVPIGTVMSRLNAARAKLQQTLAASEPSRSSADAP